MDKKLTYSLIIGILIISFSAAYYFFIFLPQKEKVRAEQQKQEQLAREQKEKEEKNRDEEKELQVKAEKCFEDAKKFHQEYIKSISGYYFEPKYNYNKKLTKCLYSGGYRKNDSLLPFNESFDKQRKSSENYWERIVKDVYTNKTILATYNFQEAETITAFWKEHDDLMNN